MSSLQTVFPYYMHINSGMALWVPSDGLIHWTRSCWLAGEPGAVPTDAEGTVFMHP